ncbi:KAP family NTPase [Paraburkholderia sp. D15]|uniref:hypothetical protein n=1 Tax=Paraburkholderia sp. D15 TaxID=2880218 RepID=UPI002479F229|nr:hypothetical protein [Paraburkholderia sp. D15]WGS50827.1 KAP family NTPase [Paraburkholderia sp. D15]
MSREHVESVVVDFIDSPVPEVLAVTGPWGVGKTYAIRKIIAGYDGKRSLKHYSYVSLFGTQSIAAVRTAILTGRRSLPFADETDESRREKVAKRMPFRDLLNQFREFKTFGIGNVVVAAETIAGAFVKDTLVCLDDIERLSKNIALQDLMGLVSELKEQSGCKVILVLNEDRLGDSKDDFERYSEKVIDQKLLFALTPAEAARLGCSENTPLRDLALDYIERLEFSNIRVIKKIERSLKLLFPVVDRRSDALKKQLVVSVCIFAAALYERGRGFPAGKEILKYNSLLRAFERVNGNRREAEPDPYWMTLLDRCDFTNADEFDKAILTAMESGYLAGSGAEDQAAALDAIARRDEMNATFNAAWNLFHNRLDVSAGDLVKAWCDAIDEAAIVISPVNLNSTVRLMRELGYNDEADAAIESYIQQRRATPKVFDIDHESRMGNVDDARFRQRCLEELRDSRREFTLQNAAEMIIENEHWDEAIPPTLAAASSAEMIALLKQHQGPMLDRLVEGIMRARGTDEENEAIRQTMISTLKAIGRESTVNELRVKRWGVELTPDGDLQA